MPNPAPKKMTKEAKQAAHLRITRGAQAASVALHEVITAYLDLESELCPCGKPDKHRQASVEDLEAETRHIESGIVLSRTLLGDIKKFPPSIGYASYLQRILKLVSETKDLDQILR